MNIKHRKNAARAMTVLMASVLTVTPLFAEGWQQTASGWKYATNANNTAWQTAGWHWLDGNKDGIAECYYFDINGYMLSNTTTPDGYTVNTDGAWVKSGTVQTMQMAQNGTWQPGTGANAGKWRWVNSDGTTRNPGWHWLDGNKDGIAECYYIGADGWMVANGKTPDGYMVNADGAWIENNIPKTKNLNGIGPGSAAAGTGYTSVGESGGSGGGGSSSGGGSGSSSSGGSSNTTIKSDDIIDQYWADYSDDISSYYVNSPTNGNMDLMSSSQWTRTKEKINEFKAQYITSDMNDFAKEIMIIKWLVQNCTYDKTTSNSATAYGCIVEGRAKCAGYADAFLQTAKLCGLDVKYIYNRQHAWNLIKLDGDWYHVDVTWEDPTGVDDGRYGFDKLRNEYINLTDSAISKVLYHKTWSPDSTAAKGTKYGPTAVREYLEYSFSPDDKTSEIAKSDAIKQTYNTDGKILVEYSNTNSAATAIYNYLVGRINTKATDYSVCVSFANVSTEEVVRYAKAVSDAVDYKVNRNYKDVVNWNGLNLSTDNYGIACANSTISYDNGAMTYTINYIYKGETIDSLTETTHSGAKLRYAIPDGYEYADAKVSSGKGNIFSGGKYYSATQDGTVIDVYLKKTGEPDDEKKEDTSDTSTGDKQDSSGNTKGCSQSGSTGDTTGGGSSDELKDFVKGDPETAPEVSYTVKYTYNGKLLKEDTGKSKRGENVEWDIPEGYKYDGFTAQSGDVACGNGGFEVYKDASFTVYLAKVEADIEDVSAEQTAE